jgi:hypothetical protein
MLEPSITPFDQPPVTPQNPVRLWKPTIIAVITFFLGFPGGIVVSSINWMRMNMKQKAVIHLVAGTLGSIALIILVILLPENSLNWLMLPVNIGIVYYLYKQMQKDVDAFAASKAVIKDAHWSGGCLISLGMLLVFFGVTFVLTFIILFFQKILAG